MEIQQDIQYEVGYYFIIEEDYEGNLVEEHITYGKNNAQKILDKIYHKEDSRVRHLIKGKIKEYGVEEVKKTKFNF